MVLISNNLIPYIVGIRSLARGDGRGISSGSFRCSTEGILHLATNQCRIIDGHKRLIRTVISEVIRSDGSRGGFCFVDGHSHIHILYSLIVRRIRRKCCLECSCRGNDVTHALGAVYPCPCSVCVPDGINQCHIRKGLTVGCRHTCRCSCCRISLCDGKVPTISKQRSCCTVVGSFSHINRYIISSRILNICCRNLSRSCSIRVILYCNSSHAGDSVITYNGCNLCISIISQTRRSCECEIRCCRISLCDGKCPGCI